MAAFSIQMELDLQACLRRAIPARPIRPEPNSHTAAGTGTTVVISIPMLEPASVWFINAVLSESGLVAYSRFVSVRVMLEVFDHMAVVMS